MNRKKLTLQKPRKIWDPTMSTVKSVLPLNLVPKRQFSTVYQNFTTRCSYILWSDDVFWLSSPKHMKNTNFYAIFACSFLYDFFLFAKKSIHLFLHNYVAHPAQRAICFSSDRTHRCLVWLVDNDLRIETCMWEHADKGYFDRMIAKWIMGVVWSYNAQTLC